MNTREIEEIFKVRVMQPSQQARISNLQSKAMELAILINDSSPDSKEKSESISNLAQSMFWVRSIIERSKA
jgi:hypothetical protein